MNCLCCCLRDINPRPSRASSENSLALKKLEILTMVLSVKKIRGKKIFSDPHIIEMPKKNLGAIEASGQTK